MHVDRAAAAAAAGAGVFELRAGPHRDEQKRRRARRAHVEEERPGAGDELVLEEAALEDLLRASRPSGPAPGSQMPRSPTCTRPAPSDSRSIVQSSARPSVVYVSTTWSGASAPLVYVTVPALGRRAPRPRCARDRRPRRVGAGAIAHRERERRRRAVEPPRPPRPPRRRRRQRRAERIVRCARSEMPRSS